EVRDASRRLHASGEAGPAEGRRCAHRAHRARLAAMEHDGERRLALLLEYDGTDFAGSQVQPGRRTVQGVVEAAVLQFTGERTRVAFSGRTDTGVHAWGQVAALSTGSAHSPATCRDALNH